MDIYDMVCNDADDIYITASESIDNLRTEIEAENYFFNEKTENFINTGNPTKEDRENYAKEYQKHLEEVCKLECIKRQFEQIRRIVKEIDDKGATAKTSIRPECE